MVRAGGIRCPDIAADILMHPTRDRCEERVVGEGQGEDIGPLERRLAQLEREHEHLASVVNSHADLLRAIGALTEVLGVSADAGPSGGWPARDTPPGPPPAAGR
jgi:hypothetical protein